MVQTVEQLNNTCSYQLKRGEVDVPAMVNRAQERLLYARRRAIAAVLSSPVWGRDYPSLRSFPYRVKYRGYSAPNERIDLFEPQTGAINIPVDQLKSSKLRRFFTPLRAGPDISRSFTQLRFLTYYTALDESKNTPVMKLAVMKRDVEEGLAIVDSVDRNSLGPVDFLLYLGIIDHLKIHTLTAFHALTFRERDGLIPEDAGYLPMREEAQTVMSACTRAYYQAGLGQPFDVQFHPAGINRAFGRVANYIANRDHSTGDFTLPEVINPVTIMLGAHEAARRKSYPDIIIGIPSGGTEVAVATALMYEKLYPELGVPGSTIFAPLSFHYKAQGGISPDNLAQLLTQLSNVAGKRVLIVDDNANSGSTLQTMSEAAIKAGAGQIFVHLAEIDPVRVLLKDRKRGGEDFGVVNMDHPDFNTAMGISRSVGEDGTDSTRRSIRRLVLRAHRKVEKRMVHV